MKIGEKLAAVTVLAGAALAGSSEYPAAAPVLEQPIVSYDAPTHKTIINLSQIALHSSLPPAVSMVDESAVAIQRAGGLGSGVKISPNEILTAGHMFVTEQASSTVAYYGCADTTISAHTANGISRIPGEDTSILHVSAQYNDAKDYALVKIGPIPMRDFMTVPEAHFTPSKDEIAKEVFFVNYEPTQATGNVPSQMRSPFSKVAPQDRNTVTDYTEPAEYGGVVIADKAGAGDNTMIVITSNRNYGKGAPETETRAGASGGPVFRADGSLMGITASITEKMDRSDISEQFGVDLIGGLNGAPQQEYRLSIIQRVDAADIRSLPNPIACR